MNDERLTPRDFWMTNVFTPKAVAILAVFLAIRTILGLPGLTIYLAPNFKLITFAYVTDALAAMFFGPVAGLAFGFAGDLLGFMVSPVAGYFPGFTISEMVTCFLFACFFFKRKVTLPRIIAVWLLNLAIVILGLNSLWLMLWAGQSAGQVFAFARVINNAVQSPLHIAILYFILTRIRRLEKHLR